MMWRSNSTQWWLSADCFNITITIHPHLFCAYEKKLEINLILRVKLIKMPLSGHIIS